MKWSDLDWDVLRSPTILLVISLLVCAVLAYAGIYVNDITYDANRQQSTQLSRVRSEYQGLEDEQKIIEEYLPRFEELEGQGIIGEEHRLQWIETLKVAAETLKLPSLKYEIGVQKPYDAEFPLKDGEFKIFATDMRLDIGMLHELDLPRLLRELSRRAEGAYSVYDCRVSRSGEVFQLDPRRPNLAATCTLRWFTIRKAEDGNV